MSAPVSSKPGSQSDPTPSDPKPEESVLKQEGGEDSEEEEGECGFCLFMKGGGCKDAFIAWENCIESAEKSGEDMVTKCFEVTSLLKKCMDEHAEYYEPVLKAEQAMADSIAEDKIADDRVSERSIAEEPEKIEEVISA